jgi:hypothetical protein
VKHLRFITVVFLLLSNIAWAAEIRFYTSNSRQQQSLISLVTGTSKPGCHNFLTKRRVYRISQVGFEYCRIFAEKNCKDEGVVTVRWKNKKQPTEKLTPGARWFLEGEQGAKISSWECHKKP